MKKILVLLMTSLVMCSLTGCGGKTATAAGPSKSYDLMGQREVTFVTPGEPWVEELRTLGQEDAELGMPADTVLGVAFRTPDDKGLISVNMHEQRKDDTGKPVELEDDQETLDIIAMRVEKRDGTRLDQAYIQVLGKNAFRMVFEIPEEDGKVKGEQVHFTLDGKYYSFSFLVPAEKYSSEQGHFRRLVESFTVKKTGSGPAPAQTPKAAATPAK